MCALVQGPLCATCDVPAGEKYFNPDAARCLECPNTAVFMTLALSLFRPHAEIWGAPLKSTALLGRRIARGCAPEDL